MNKNENFEDINLNIQKLESEMKDLLEKSLLKQHNKAMNQKNSKLAKSSLNSSRNDDSKDNIRVCSDKTNDSLSGNLNINEKFELLNNYKILDNCLNNINEKIINSNNNEDEEIAFLYKHLKELDDNYTELLQNNVIENNNTDIKVNENISQLERIVEQIKLQKKENFEIDQDNLTKKAELQCVIKDKEKLDSTVESAMNELLSYEALEHNLIEQNNTLISRINNGKERYNNIEKINLKYIEYLKVIHNELLENKGNIRVFCRVRPLLKKEIDKINETKESINNISSNNMSKKEISSKALKSESFLNPKHLEYQDSYLDFSGADKLIVKGPVTKSNVGKTQDNQTKDIYYFDKVFPHNTSQITVFDEISQLVQSALDGYKVCIFAYGQTGSGKTFTMEGDKSNPGIIPRSLEKIFSVKNYLTSLGWTFTINLSYFEIYLDQIQDLLSKTKKILNQYELKDIISLKVDTIEEITPILEFATKNRTIAHTNCNEKSSRSHSVCQLNIFSQNTETGEKREGALNLIDLAGSERVAQSKVEGEKLKEAVSINKSLYTLKGVISALNNGQTKHIPYRESVLTYVLQQYLGGDSKTLMFVNISPLITQINETTCSLKFATEVNSCTIK